MEDDVELLFMQSSGGLTTAPFFHGENSLLSGPAGGVIGAVAVAQQAGFDKIVSFDMGGTSTDTAHFIGEKNKSNDYEKTFDTVIAGARVRVPMLKVETLAAGGGSICHFDGSAMTVGPHSAGSNPGPACYGRGGPLTITDCHVMLGRLRPEFFPSIFGKNNNEPLDKAVVHQKFLELSSQMKKSPEAIASGFMKIADEKMSAGIKKISMAMGHNIKNHLLVGFGGNGGQHVCAIADNLGIDHALLHPLAGVLSAYGIGMAGVTARRERSVGLRLNDSHLKKITALSKELIKEAEAELIAQSILPADLHYHLHCRYAGSDVTLPLAIPFQTKGKDSAHLSAKKIFLQFQKLHHEKFGFTQKTDPSKLIIELIAIVLQGHNATAGRLANYTPHNTSNGQPTDAIITTASVFIDKDGKTTKNDIPILSRANMKPNKKIMGPAIIIENTSTNFVAAGWGAQLLKNHSLLLTRDKKTKRNMQPRRQVANTTADPVTLEIFNNRFMTIAEQMGFTLQNTAFSVNIKERLDFSCAIFDNTGDLIANAPHIPVHLGSMADSVRYLIKTYQTQKKKLKMGDSFLMNSPYHGGTHLPDVTVINPVFIDNKLTFFVASRGHHTDIGGISPGSMPAHSQHIDEEGILIDHFHLVKNGVLQTDGLKKILTNHPHPVRDLAQNFSDIHAQLAANKKGISELEKTCEEYGRAQTAAYMGFMKQQAANEVKKVIGQLRDGHFTYPMDNGAVITLSLTIDKKNQTATVDFTGTSPIQPNNFNAPFAIVKSVLLYVFRTLINKNISLNEGCLHPIRIIVPENCMLRPRYPAAVVAGNVETSQVIADCLYGAMGVMAACQGTMNNLTFGNQQYQYYETIAGGTGAGQKLNGTTFHGADAVHSHMTNSRMTDPEIMEARYPVRIIEYAIRQGSGGGRDETNHDIAAPKNASEHIGQNAMGKKLHQLYPGGNGFTKRILFLEKMTLNILANHRVVPPFGLHGGAAGKVGENYIEDANGNIDHLSATDSRLIKAGDIFTIHTPGGGAFGEAD